MLTITDDKSLLAFVGGLVGRHVFGGVLRVAVGGAAARYPREAEYQQGDDRKAERGQDCRTKAARLGDCGRYDSARHRGGKDERHN